MKMSMSVLVMVAAVSSGAAAQVDLVLFPTELFNASGIANPELAYTRFLVVPRLDGSDLDEILGKTDWWAGIGESIPLLALSLSARDLAPELPVVEILRITAVAGGLLNLHSTMPADYSLGGDLLLSSPAFDRVFNPYDEGTGNRLVLSFGYRLKASGYAAAMLDDLPGSLARYGWLVGNAFAVAKAPYSDQFCILGVGYTKPLAKPGDAQATWPYLDFSLTMELPFFVGRNGLPYFSVYGRVWDYTSSEVRLHAGVKLPGEVSHRDLIIPFVEVVFGTHTNQVSVGTKVNL
jgi:hypothetical protein